MEYVTDTGLKKKTLQELRIETENGLKQFFGVGFETSVDSPNGLLISQLALANSRLWDLAQEIYSSLDPNQATGTALDARASFNGVTRKPAEACTVTAMLYTEEASATIPAGSIANRQRGDLDFALDEAVSIDRASCAELMLDISDVESGTYTLEFSFGNVSWDTTSSTTLASLITTAGGTAEDTPRGLRVTYSSGSVGLTGSIPDGLVVQAGEPGNFTAVSTGYQTCEIGELDNIPTSVDGWSSVYNYEAGTPGADLESDASLRIRREAAAKVKRSKATDPAIEAALLDVPGVTTARVFSNRGFDTNADGVPGKSFTSLVVGGTDADIARCIYENQPSGIQSWGNTSVNVTDSHGFEQQISFSRPTPKYLWVKFYYHVYDEEVFPGADAIKQAMVEWADKQYTLGKDVIPTRIPGGIYELVAGVGVSMAHVAITDSPDTVPSSGDYSWDTALAIPPFAYAVLEEDRIETILEND